MKKISSIFLSALLAFTIACKNEDKDPEPTPVVPTDELEIIEGEISGVMQLDASKKYLLRGKVYVLNGGEIKIPAGTIIFGEKNTDGTLVINRGGKIEAIGEPSKPIIMTSQAPVGFRNRGDWGGVVILGNGYTNGSASSVMEGLTADAGSENGLYGPGAGNPIENQNSGTLKYVRIEFAGIDLSLDNELNSLTMGAVGSETKIDNIMVSYANDDAYEWFGGSNSSKYLIAYNTLDDDFDNDRGFNGKIQYGLVVREPLTADISGSRAFECSSNNAAPATHGGVSRHSKPYFANITVLGPRLFKSTIDGFYQAAVEINSSSDIEIHNSILTGFPTGVRFNSAGSTAKVVNSIFAENPTVSAISGNTAELPADFDTNTEEGNITNIFGAFNSVPSNGENTKYNFASPTYLQAANSPYLTGAPDLTAAGFEKQDFYGAFGSSAIAGWDINAGWIEWNPISAQY